MTCFSFSGIVRNLIVAVVILACVLSAAHATTYTFFAGGLWSTSTNWVGNNVPLTITSGDAIVIDGPCNLDVNITVPAGATITINPSGDMIMAGGNFTLEGELTVAAGASLEWTSPTSIINYTNGSITLNGTANLLFAGTLTSSGSGTFAVGATGIVNMNNIGELVIGGTGTVASGGSISLQDPGTALTLSSNATFTSSGTVSLVNATSALTLGTAASFTSSGTVAVGGTLSIGDYASLASSGTLTINGTLTMDPTASMLHNQTGGIAYINANTSLNGTQTVQNDGAILVDNAVTLTIGSGATLINLGAVNGAGTLQMDGTYQGTGSVGADFTGTGTVMPGNPAGLQTACTSFNGGYSFTGTWEIELEGTGGCADHDQVTSGAASFPLGGTLNVTLGASYTPVLPATYIILVATNITGSFTPPTLPPVPGAAWSIVYNITTVELTLTACTPPDVPLVTASKSHSCVVGGTGELITLDVGGASLGDATDWTWYEGSCGGTSIGIGPTLVIAVPTTTTYYVRGEGGCVGTSATCGSITITAGDAPVISAFHTATYSNGACNGNAALVVNITNGTGPFTLAYEIDNIPQNVTNYTSGDTLIVPQAPGTAIYHLLNTTDANGCGDATVTPDLTLISSAAYDVTLAVAGPTSVCNGATTQLQLTSTGTNNLSFNMDNTEGEGPYISPYVPGTPIPVTPGSGYATYNYNIYSIYDVNGCPPANVLVDNVTITQNTNPAYRVNAASASGAPDGLTWADAFPNLHAAFDAQAACPGVTEIWVAAGTYKPERDINNVVNATNPANTFKLPSNVAVYGGFPATGDPAFASRNASTNPTILSGDIGVANDPADNVYHVVYVPGTVANTVLDGFTLSGGNATQPTAFDGLVGANAYGGGILFGGLGSGVLVNDCILTNNTATNGGGAATRTSGLANTSDPRLTNCTFSNNDATETGAGLYIGGDGSFNSSSPRLTSCVFEDNVAANDGGAIYVNGSSMGTSNTEITNCVFSANVATTGAGGAVYLDGNASGNCNPVLTNCLFTGNDAPNGGAIYGESATSTLTNCTLHANNATTNGGAAYITNGACTLTNGIVWGNTATTNPGVSTAGAVFTMTYTLDQDNTAGTGNLGTATPPTFVNAGNPIGADNTWMTNDDGLRIANGSSGANVGDPGITTPLTDLSGLNRVGIFDMGAYEYTACVPLGNANRLYVNSFLGVDGEGASWGDGYMNLTNALQKAYDCPQITEMWVAAGTYKPTNNPVGCTTCSGGRDVAFRIPDGLDIYGGFDNSGNATLLSQRNPTANPTILSGDLIGDDGSAMYSDNAYHVVLMLNNTASTTFDGFTVQGGVADGAGFISFGAVNVFQSNGGGIAMFNASPVVQNCIIQNNQATSNGGGAYSTNYGSPTFTTCEVLNNYAGSFGGGIHINATASTVTISNCLIVNNNASTMGGGLALTAGGTYAVTGTVVADNASQQGGGIYADGSSQVNMTNTVLSKNTSGTASNGMVEIINASASATNCTFVATGVAAEGACLLNGPGSSLTVVNSIIWNNSDPILTDATGTTTVTYSIVQGASTYPGTGNSADNPLFLSLATPKGADNAWLTTDDGYTLQSGSPAINTGNPLVTSPTLDILDVTRTGIFDMGAYEGASICSVLGANTRLYVNGSTANDGIGTDWLTAYKSLGNALQKAYDCSQITEMWVKSETYLPNLDATWQLPAGDPRNATFRIPSTLRVFGGFAGTETTLAQRDFVLNPTILSGDIGTPATGTDNSYNVVTITGGDTLCALDGFIVRDGNGSGGGGILINGGAKPRIRHCVVTANTAPDGGGILIDNAQPRLISTVIADNAGENGGGVRLGGGAIAGFYNCVFASNSATSYGGSFFSFGATLNMANCVIANNTAPDGGAGYLWDDITNAKNSIFYNNTGIPVLGESGSHAGTFSQNIMPFSLPGSFTNTGQLNDDPLFAYPANPIGPDGKWFTTDDGLKILCGSPAIDAGGSLGAPAGTTYKDILGTLRPQGAAYDIGAYEWIPLAGTTTRLYVNQSTTGTQEGTDWTLAFKELRDALACQAITPSVTQIWVAAGEYKPTTGTARTATFALKPGLALYGDFAGTESFLADRVPNTTSFTVLSGDIGVTSDPADDVYHVVTASGPSITNSDSLNGFRVKHGNANGAGINEAKGGGMLIVGGAYPTVVGCTFDNNLATDGGGVAIIAPGTSAAQITEMNNCTLTNNTATNSGGGIYAEQMMVKFTGDTDISNNTHTGSCE